MIHTNETLSARDDDYISKLVTIIELRKAGYKAEMWQMETFKDYCNSPNDIMPIVLENRINHEHLKHADMTEEWRAYIFNDSGAVLDVYNPNLYRAYSELLILMNQVDV